MMKNYFLFFSLALGTIAYSGTAGEPPVNLALGARTSASSEQAPSQHAVDGKFDTRWDTKPNVDPGWIMLDLGSRKTFRKIHLFWENAYASEYNLEISDNGKAWRTIFVEKDGLGKFENIVLPKPVTTRYFRILGKKRATSWGYSLWEIQLFQ